MVPQNTNEEREIGVTSSRRGVCFVGPLPPPVHGMAAVNAVVIDRLRASGLPVHLIDVAGPRP